jgi:hypothetical protein
MTPARTTGCQLLAICSLGKWRSLGQAGCLPMAGLGPSGYVLPGTELCAVGTTVRVKFFPPKCRESETERRRYVISSFPRESM